MLKRKDVFRLWGTYSNAKHVKGYTHSVVSMSQTNVKPLVTAHTIVIIQGSHAWIYNEENNG